MRPLTAIAVLCIVLAQCPVWAAENLLRNGGFEEGQAAPTGWTFIVFSTKPSRGALEWSTDAHSGERSARVIGVENAGAEAVRGLIFSAPVDVQEGLYQLTGWYKTDGAARAHLQIPIYTEDFPAKAFSTPAQDTLHRNLDVAQEWSPFEVEFSVKAGAKQLVIMLRASDIGGVQYDDVSLEPVEDVLTLRLYPAEFGRENTLPLIRGEPNFARIMMAGDRARIKESVEIVLDLPEGTGDFGLLGGGEAVQRDGDTYRRLRIPIPPETLKALRRTVSHCSVTFWIDAADMPDTGTIHYRAVVDGQEQQEERARVKVLPALRDGPRPERFLGFYCWGLFSQVPEMLWPAVYDMVRRMGVTHHLGSGQEIGWRGYLLNRLREDGGKLWANISSELTRAMREKGWETRIIAEGKDFFRIADAYYQEVAPLVDGVFWDWEPANAMHNPLWDHAPTVAAFAAKEGLDAAALTEDKLKGDLREEFLAFRTWQLGEVVRLWAEYIHDLRPDLTIAICQGSGMPPDRHLDYKAYDDIPGLVHLPMIYISSPMGFARNVAGTRDYLPEARLIPMTSTSMVADGGWLAAKTPRSIYFDFVSSALLGCDGCSHWPDLNRGMDMEYVWELTRAVQHIASVEEFLFDGERAPDGVSVQALPESEARIKTGRGEVVIASPQWDKHALCFSYRLGDETLAAVCNMHPDTLATVSVRIPDARGDGWRLWDPVSRTALVPDTGETWTAEGLAEGVLFEVPPLSLGMLVADRRGPEGGPTDQIRATEVRQRLQARQAQAAAEGGIAVVREGDLEIGWEDMDGDGNAEVRIASPHQALGIGPSGNLWSWQVRGREGDLVSRFDGGGACEDRFWWPEDARASDDGRREYELVVREVKAGKASVTFSRKLAHWSLGGLVLEKTYSVGADSPSFEVRVTVRNASPDEHEFSYWSHNCFHVGHLPSLAIETAEGTRVFSGVDQPREIWAPLRGLPDDQTPLLKSDPTAMLTSRSLILGDASGAHIEAQLDPSLLQLYRWWDGTERGRYTLEWMHQKQALRSGAIWSTRYRVTWRP